MQHRSKEICVESWVPKALLQSVAAVVGTFGVYSGKTDLFFCWNVVLEGWKVDAIYVNFVGHDEESRRHGRKPLK